MIQKNRPKNIIESNKAKKIKNGNTLVSEEIFNQELIKWLVMSSYPPAIRSSKNSVNKKSITNNKKNK